MLKAIVSMFRRPKLDEVDSAIYERIRQRGYDAARDAGEPNPYPRGTPSFKAFREGEDQHAAEELRIW